MGVSILTQPPELSKKLQAKMKAQMPQLMDRCSRVMQSAIQDTINKGVPPPNAPLTAAVKGGKGTLRDNRDLAGSISAHHGDNWASSGTNKKQAWVLQHGKTIMSKGKGLWLPANANTRTLYRQYNAQTPGQLITAMKSAGFKFFRVKNVYCAQSKKGQPFALFIVKKSVTIPARRFVKFTDSARNTIKKIWKDALHAALGSR